MKYWKVAGLPRAKNRPFYLSNDVMDSSYAFSHVLHPTNGQNALNIYFKANTSQIASLLYW